MKTRAYGSTGKFVSEIGFGAWQLGSDMWGGPEEADGIRLVQEAVDKGVNFFDSAPGYGAGLSEIILGKALKGVRDKVVINTKLGFPAGNRDYRLNHEFIEKSIDESLERLQTDYLDSILLHNPPFELLNGSSPHYEVFEKLKAKGKIGAYGASVDTSKDMFELINTTPSGVVEILYNIFFQETADAIKLAGEKNIAVIVKVPLDSGWLSGKYNSKSIFVDDVRDRWDDEQISRRAELLDKISFATENNTSMIQAALRFVLALPGVSTVIPGMKNIEQMLENVSASDAEMPAEHVEKLIEIWNSDIKDNMLKW